MYLWAVFILQIKNSIQNRLSVSQQQGTGEAITAELAFMAQVGGWLM